MDDTEDDDRALLPFESDHVHGSSKASYSTVLTEYHGNHVVPGTEETADAYSETNPKENTCSLDNPECVMEKVYAYREIQPEENNVTASLNSPECFENKEYGVPGSKSSDGAANYTVIHNDCDNEKYSTGNSSVNNPYMLPHVPISCPSQDDNMKAFAKELIAKVIDNALLVYRSETHSAQPDDGKSNCGDKTNNGYSSLRPLPCDENTTPLQDDNSGVENSALQSISSGGDISGSEATSVRKATCLTEEPCASRIEDVAVMLVDDAFTEAYGIIQGDLLPWEAILQESNSDEESPEDDFEISCDPQDSGANIVAPVTCWGESSPTCHCGQDIKECELSEIPVEDPYGTPGSSSKMVTEHSTEIDQDTLGEHHHANVDTRDQGSSIADELYSKVIDFPKAAQSSITLEKIARCNDFMDQNHHDPEYETKGLEDYARSVVASAIRSGVQAYRNSLWEDSAENESETNITGENDVFADVAAAEFNDTVDQKEDMGCPQDGLMSETCAGEPALTVDRSNDFSAAPDSGKLVHTVGTGAKSSKKKRGRFRRKCVSTKVPGKGYKHKSLAETYDDLVYEETMFHDSFSCPVCWDVLYSAHSCRPCRHVFCEPCLRRLAKYCKDGGRPALCPICREPISFCVKDTPLSQSVEELFPDDYHRRRRTEGRGRYMTHPLPSKEAERLPPEHIAQLLAHARNQRQRRPRLQFNPGRLSATTFISFALVFILLKGMVGVAVMALYNMSLGYAIGDTVVTAASLLEDLRATNIVFSWIVSAIAFSLTAFVFFACRKFYERWRNR